MKTLSDSRLNPTAGWLWIVGAILAIAFMLHHPSMSSHETSELLAELRDEGAISAWVHGLLIVVMMGWWLAGYGLTQRLGNHCVLPVLGLQMFSIGIFGYSIAAIVSGFISPEIGRVFADTSIVQMEQGRNLLRISWAVNQTFANIGLVASSIAIVVWGSALLSRSGVARLAGILGIFAGVVPLLLQFSGHLQLHIVGMTMIVVVQGIWYLLIGVLMLWGPLHDRAQSEPTD